MFFCIGSSSLAFPCHARHGSNAGLIGNGRLLKQEAAFARQRLSHGHTHASVEDIQTAHGFHHPLPIASSGAETQAPHPNAHLPIYGGGATGYLSD